MSINSFNLFRNIYCPVLRYPSLKIQRALFCNASGKSQISIDESSKQSGFAKSYEKFDGITKVESPPPETFETLLRNSKFIDVRNLIF